MKRVTLVHVDWKTNISIFLVVNYSNYAEPLVSEYVMAGYPGTLGASKHVESLGSSVIDYVLVGNAIESVNVKDLIIGQITLQLNCVFIMLKAINAIRIKTLSVVK